MTNEIQYRLQTQNIGVEQQISKEKKACKSPKWCSSSFDFVGWHKWRGLWRGYWSWEYARGPCWDGIIFSERAFEMGEDENKARNLLPKGMARHPLGLVITPHHREDILCWACLGCRNWGLIIVGISISTFHWSNSFFIKKKKKQSIHYVKNCRVSR